MKPYLQVNVIPRLTMTPKLQQAIKFLQLSTLELQQEIRQQLDTNPLLEEITEIEDLSYDEDVFEEVEWSTFYAINHTIDLQTETESSQPFVSTQQTLQDHLKWQLELTPLSDIDRLIGFLLIDAINDDGLLTVSIDELYDFFQQEAYEITREDIAAVLHRIQRFDPVGCGATDLAECLLLQLQQLPESTPCLSLTKTIISEQIKQLNPLNYAKLIKRYKLSAEQIQGITALITHLNPKPGSIFQHNTTAYLIPELMAKKIKNRWHIALNFQELPQLKINRQHLTNVKDTSFLKAHLKEAKWLINSLEQRQETLLKVGSYLVNFQKAFLERGEEAMKPLTLAKVAHDLGIHQSTVSRITSQKYIHTPKGIFELKTFFSNATNSACSDNNSSVALRALIKKLIATENPLKPLNDQQLAQIISNQGVHIARRTVAKYRKQLNIPTSYARKKIDL